MDCRKQTVSNQVLTNQTPKQLNSEQSDSKQSLQATRLQATELKAIITLKGNIDFWAALNFRGSSSLCVFNLWEMRGQSKQEVSSQPNTISILSSSLFYYFRTWTHIMSFHLATGSPLTAPSPGDVAQTEHHNTVCLLGVLYMSFPSLF